MAAFLATVISVLVLGGGSAFAATSVSGTVKDADGHAITTQDICVVVLGQAFGPPGHYSPFGVVATTDPSGAWTVTGLAAGTYKFRASDCTGSTRNDLDTYYDPANTGAGEEVVLAPDATLTDIDISMARATSIGGRVYDGPGTAKPVSGMCVTASSEFGFVQAGASSGADGSYTLSRLDPARKFTLMFGPCNISPLITEYEFWTQLYGGDTPTVVAPTLAHPATGIDLHLRPILSITGGSATGPTSASFRFSGWTWPNATFLCAVDDAPLAACGADYTATGLSAGTHTLQVQAWAGTLHTPVRTFSWDFVPGEGRQGSSPPPVAEASAPPVAAVQTPTPAATQPAHCKVPNLKRRSLARARAALSRANCSVGTVSKPKKRVHNKSLKVRSQSLKPGSTRKADTKVSLKLAYA